MPVCLFPSFHDIHLQSLFFFHVPLTFVLFKPAGMEDVWVVMLLFVCVSGCEYVDGKNKERKRKKNRLVVIVSPLTLL
jgi:hypothetical protein